MIRWETESESPKLNSEAGESQSLRATHEVTSRRRAWLRESVLQRAQRLRGRDNTARFDESKASLRISLPLRQAIEKEEGCDGKDSSATPHARKRPSFVLALS